MYKVIICIILAVSIVSCSGQKTRDVASTVLIYLDDNIQNDIYRGIGLIEEREGDGFNEVEARRRADMFFRAVESGDRWIIATQALPHWVELSHYAQTGYHIDRQNGNLSAESIVLLQTNLNQYGIVLRQVSQGAKPNE